MRVVDRDHHRRRVTFAVDHEYRCCVGILGTVLSHVCDALSSESVKNSVPAHRTEHRAIYNTSFTLSTRVVLPSVQAWSRPASLSRGLNGIQSGSYGEHVRPDVQQSTVLRQANAPSRVRSTHPTGKGLMHPVWYAYRGHCVSSR